MNAPIPQAAPAFGGRWTEEKLVILERYLDAYTTALRSQPFQLWYIDAFAGTGRVELPTEEQGEIRHLVSGSTERAIKIRNRPFDKLIFVEQDAERCCELEKLKETHANRNIRVVNGDANVYLAGLGDDWGGRRGVLFLDPFATQVSWATLERVASYRALDTWLLFPVSAISRMLPTLRRPDEIDERWVSRLTTVFGDESWRDLYRRRAQPDLFIAEAFERDSGVDGLCSIYQDRLSNLFGDRYLARSRTLKNSRNSAFVPIPILRWPPSRLQDRQGYRRAHPEEFVDMSTYSSIEWTDVTWNPVTGCTKISHGCKHCYAERMANRLQKMGANKYREGFSVAVHETALGEPLTWKRPRFVFVNSMSDLFHQAVPAAFVESVFDVMNRAPQHTFQVLTKRPHRVVRMTKRLRWGAEHLAWREHRNPNDGSDGCHF